MFWIPVQGTNGWPEHPEHEWWFAGDALAGPSPFVRFMAAQGWHVWDAADQYVWSTDVNGLMRFLPGGGKEDWRAGGFTLRRYRADLPIELRYMTAVVCHSHGLQCVLEDLADERALPLAALISVGSPIRADMADVARIARLKIGYWLHLHAGFDLWQRAGQLFDGNFNPRGTWPKGYPQPDQVVDLPGIGVKVHGELLRNEARFPLWKERGWLVQLEAAAAAF